MVVFCINRNGVNKGVRAVVHPTASTMEGTVVGVEVVVFRKGFSHFKGVSVRICQNRFRFRNGIALNTCKPHDEKIDRG